MFFSFLFCFSISELRYSIVVDCGSSGSRPYIYSYDNSEKWPNVTLIDYKDLEIKMADAAENPEVAADLIKNIYEYAETVIPNELMDKTSIIMYATAGMRLLTEDKQKEVLDLTINEIKKQTKFIVDDRKIRVISGNEEGSFMWLAINNIDNHFSPDYSVGSLDLGGASAQIAMETTGFIDVTNSDYHLFTIKDNVYILFSHSYLGMGINEFDNLRKDELIKGIKENEVEDPCYYNNYNVTYNDKLIKGNINYEKCKQLTWNVLQTLIAGVEIPQLKYTDKIFYGFGTFGSFIEFTNTSETLHLSELKNLSEVVCNMPLEEVMERQPEYYATECVAGVLEYEMLSDAFKFTENNVFIMSDRVNGVKVSWTMGALIDDLYDLFDSSPTYEESSKIGILICVIIGSLLLITFIILFIVYAIKRCAKAKQLQPGFRPILNQ